MEFKKGAGVYTAEGKEIGRVDRVVIEPGTNEITYLVIRQGVLFTDDRVLPAGLVEKAEGDRVTLQSDAGDLETLPPFEIKQYVPASQLAGDAPDAYYAYPAAGGFVFQPTVRQVEMAQTERSIPDADVALKAGAAVLSSDEKHVGNIERVLADGDTQRVTHFTLTQGGLLSKATKLIPVQWAEEIDDEAVYLSVDAATIERLPTWEG